jgi:hypothetical protein
MSLILTGVMALAYLAVEDDLSVYWLLYWFKEDVS